MYIVCAISVMPIPHKKSMVSRLTQVTKRGELGRSYAETDGCRFIHHKLRLQMNETTPTGNGTKLGNWVCVGYRMIELVGL